MSGSADHDAQICLDREANITTTVKYGPADSYAFSKPPVIIRCKPEEWEKALVSSIVASKRTTDCDVQEWIISGISMGERATSHIGRKRERMRSS